MTKNSKGKSIEPPIFLELEQWEEIEKRYNEFIESKQNHIRIGLSNGEMLNINRNTMIFINDYV